MKTLIATLILFFTALNFELDAQGSNIDYNRYRFPEVRFRALTGNGNLGGFSSKSSPNGENQFRNSFNNRLTADYRTFNYSASKQAESNIYFSNSVDFEKTDLSKRSNFAPSVSYSNFDRTFDKRNNFFEWGTSTNLSGSFGEVDEESRRNYGSDVRFSVLLGHGRIEPATTVFTAKFIVDELLADGILQTELDQEVLFALADQIAILQNKRVFDTRNFRKFVVKNLTEWMLTNAKVEQSKIIDLTTIIADNWLFANLSQRSTGKSISYGLEPSYRYNYSNNPSEPINKSNSLGLNGVVSYRHFKQKSQYFQTSFIAQGNVNVTSSPLTKFDRRTFVPNIDVSYAVGYYPNTRTEINLTASLSTYANMIRFKGLDFTGNDIVVVLPSLYLSYDYFVNYNMKLFGYLRASHQNISGITPKYSDTDLAGNFGMSYIFY